MASVPASEPIYTKPISDEMAAILAPRIMRNIRVTTTGCWVRTVNVNAYTGYANIAIKQDGKADYYFAHRVMYVFRRGQIPDGMTIDHLCRVRACCNPAHLEVVTLRENVQRRNRAPLAVPEGPPFRRPKPRKPCVGHAFIPDASGKRCSTCARVSAAALKRVRAAAAEERPE